MARRSDIQFVVDARSVKDFSKNCSIAIKGVGECTHQAIDETCGTILEAATALVPIDTGALARSADYTIKRGKKGYEARCGYGIGRRNPVNKRTGKAASTYAGRVHEGLGGRNFPMNGQPKFLEQAVYANSDTLQTSAGKAISEYLAKDKLQAINEAAEKRDQILAKLDGATAARIQAGFTAQVGTLLPYPVPTGTIMKRGGVWVLLDSGNKKRRERIEAQSRKNRPKNVRRYKKVSETAQSVRNKEASRWAQKSNLRGRARGSELVRSTGPISSVTHKSTKKKKASKKVQSAQTPSRRKAKKTYQGVSLRADTAIEEFMASVQGSNNEDDDE